MFACVRVSENMVLNRAEWKCRTQKAEYILWNWCKASIIINDYHNNDDDNID